MKIRMSCGHEEDWPDPDNNENKQAFMAYFVEQLAKGLQVPCNQCFKEEQKNEEKACI